MKVIFEGGIATDGSGYCDYMMIKNGAIELYAEIPLKRYCHEKQQEEKYVFLDEFDDYAYPLLVKEIAKQAQAADIPLDELEWWWPEEAALALSENANFQ